MNNLENEILFYHIHKITKYHLNYHPQGKCFITTALKQYEVTKCFITTALKQYEVTKCFIITALKQYEVTR